MKRSFKANSNKPQQPNKAFLGTALAIGGLVASVGSSVYQNIKQRKAQNEAEEAKELSEEEALNRMRNLEHGNDALYSSEYRKLYDSSDSYRLGGTTKSTIKDGVYKAHGPSHENGGIQLAKNLEIEGDEVVVKNGNNVKVLSNQNIAGGVSPAEVVAGNPDEKTINMMLKNQENMKRKLGYNDDGTRSSSSTGKGSKNKAKLGIDGVTALINTGSSLISGVGNLVSAAGQKAPTQSDLVLPNAPKTIIGVNDNAKKANISRSRDRMVESIDENTGSSNVALQRRQMADLLEQDSLNEVEEQTLNKENENRNRQQLLEYQNDANNAAAINQNNQQYAASLYEHNLRKTQNVSGAIASLSNSLQTGAKWFSDKKTLSDYRQKQLDILERTDPNGSYAIASGKSLNTLADDGETANNAALISEQMGAGTIDEAQAKSKINTITDIDLKNKLIKQYQTLFGKPFSI